MEKNVITLENKVKKQPTVSVEPKKVAKPKKPSINWKERAEKLEKENAYLKQNNEVNEHEIIQIAKQRDEAIRSFREADVKAATAQVIVELNTRANKAVNNILMNIADLNNVTNNYSYILARENNLSQGEE